MRNDKPKKQLKVSVTLTIVDRDTSKPMRHFKSKNGKMVEIDPPGKPDKPPKHEKIEGNQ